MSTQSQHPSTDGKRSSADQAVLDAIARLPTPSGPPEAVDEAILAASRRAVKGRPLAKLKPWLSIAAGVFVVFFAANLLQRESAKESAQSERISLPATPRSDADNAEVNAPAAMVAEEAATTATPAEPPIPAKKADQSPPAAAALRSAPEPEPQQAAPAASKPAPVAAPAAPARRPQTFPADDGPAPAQSAPPAAPATLAPAPSPSPARERANPRSAAGAVGAASAAAGPGERSKAAPVAELGEPEAGLRSEAERWFERIREQQRNGEPAQARALLKQFRSRYPDLPLPADLRALEEDPR